jgi:hypothetical protein
MAKQDPKDLFGFSDNNGPEDGDEDADLAYVILQIIPAEGWRAVYIDDNGQRTILKLACFALVEVPTQDPQDPQVLPVRVVRPMVATNDGQIEDAEVIDDFLILVAPPVLDNPYDAQGSLETQIVNALSERARADKARK